jgi:hypothetical protein
MGFNITVGPRTVDEIGKGWFYTPKRHTLEPRIPDKFCLIHQNLVHRNPVYWTKCLRQKPRILDILAVIWSSGVRGSGV